jgi:hypothetical protein
VIAAGLFVAAAGFSVEIFGEGDPGTGLLRLNTAVSNVFFGAWALVVVALVVADLWQGKTRHS